MENIKVNLRFFEKAWEASDGNPHRDLVCFPGLITMIVPISLLQFCLQPCRDPSLPELDAQWYQCQVWEAIVDAAIGDGVHVQSNLLQFDWGLMRRKLVKAMGETAHDRYADWYGSTKRKLEEESESAVTRNNR